MWCDEAGNFGMQMPLKTMRMPGGIIHSSNHIFPAFIDLYTINIIFIKKYS